MPPMALNPKPHPQSSFMKSFILPLLLCLSVLVYLPQAQAGWFNTTSEEQLHQSQKLQQTENQLLSQRQTTDQWEAIAAFLAVGCVLLFVIGTALGAKTRRHASVSQLTHSR